MILPQVIIPVIFVSIVAIAWFVVTYNRFVKYRNKIEETWSGIDVALKRRYNLIWKTKLFHFGSGNPAGIAPGGIFQKLKVS